MYVVLRLCFTCFLYLSMCLLYGSCFVSMFLVYLFCLCILVVSMYLVPCISLFVYIDRFDVFCFSVSMELCFEFAVLPEARLGSGHLLRQRRRKKFES